MKLTGKKIFAALAVIAALLILTAVTAMIILSFRTEKLHDGYASVYEDKRYSSPVNVQGIEVITQDVSCGYAVIEMFSAYTGGDIKEEKLYDKYGKVVTSTGGSFCDEMNKQFEGYDTVMYKYLTDTQLISKVYDSLSAGVPVPFEWAAKTTDGIWTLHYSLITGMDIAEDKVTIANPYGYYEEITVKEFLERTSFEAYEDMPLFLKLGFAFGIFEKNTVFIPTKK